LFANVAKREKPDFEEVAQDAAPRTRRSSSRVAKLFFSDSGQLDYDRTDAEHIGRAVEALSKDPTYTHLFQQETKSGLNVIEPKHVEWFLTAVEKLERFLIPRLVARKAVFGQPVGAFRIDADVAERAFTFPKEDREKIVPLGVETANANLPEKVKLLITKVGPGTEFLGRIMVSLQEQQVRAIQLQVAKYQKTFRDSHPPGFAAQPPASPAPQQKTNGVAAASVEQPQPPTVTEIAGVEVPTA
jgi:hypothetical protein